MKFFGFVLMIAALTGFALVGIDAYGEFQAAPVQAQNAPKSTQTAQTRTETPEPTQTPMPDYSATETAISGIVAQAEATRQAGDIQVESAKAAQAAALLEAEKERTRQKEIEAARVATSEANALAHSQIEATRQAEANRAAAIAVAQQAEQNRAKSLELEAARLEQSSRNQWAVWLMLALGLVVIGVIVWVIVRRPSEVVSEAEEVTDDDDEISPMSDEAMRWLAREPVQVNGENEAMQYPAPFSPDEAAAIIKAGGLVNPVSFRAAADAGIKRARWSQLRNDLVPVFAEKDKDDSIILTLAGCELVKKVATPPPHSPARVSEVGVLAEDEQHDTARHTPDTAEGEGSGDPVETL
jgi:hypothetical protein